MTSAGTIDHQSQASQPTNAASSSKAKGANRQRRVAPGGDAAEWPAEWPRRGGRGAGDSAIEEVRPDPAGGYQGRYQEGQSTVNSRRARAARKARFVGS
ncbi:MAG: hypothetical protein ACK55I_47495, partial [bacterium]